MKFLKELLNEDWLIALLCILIIVAFAILSLFCWDTSIP